MVDKERTNNHCHDDPRESKGHFVKGGMFVL